MKKAIMALVAVCVTVAGFAIGTSSTVQAAVDTKSLDCNGSVPTRCVFCGGTGFRGNYNCPHCKGTGRTSSY